MYKTCLFKREEEERRKILLDTQMYTKEKLYTRLLIHSMVTFTTRLDTNSDEFSRTWTN